MTLKMTTAQVVETSVTVTNSSFQNYTHPDDHTTQTTDTPGFKPLTTLLHMQAKSNSGFSSVQLTAWTPLACRVPQHRAPYITQMLATQAMLPVGAVLFYLTKVWLVFDNFLMASISTGQSKYKDCMYGVGIIRLSLKVNTELSSPLNTVLVLWLAKSCQKDGKELSKLIKQFVNWYPAEQA